MLQSVSVRHLCRSAQAAHVDTTQAWPIRVLYIGLELETVLAKAQVEVSTYLMPEMVTGEGNVSLRIGQLEYDHYECA